MAVLCIAIFFTSYVNFPTTGELLATKLCKSVHIGGQGFYFR